MKEHLKKPVTFSHASELFFEPLGRISGANEAISSLPLDLANARLGSSESGAPLGTLSQRAVEAGGPAEPQESRVALVNARFRNSEAGPNTEFYTSFSSEAHGASRVQTPSQSPPQAQISPPRPAGRCPTQRQAGPASGPV